MALCVSRLFLLANRPKRIKNLHGLAFFTVHITLCQHFSVVRFGKQNLNIRKERFEILFSKILFYVYMCTLYV